jgi:hypothetical protein
MEYQFFKLDLRFLCGAAAAALSYKINIFMAGEKNLCADN